MLRPLRRISASSSAPVMMQGHEGAAAAGWWPSRYHHRDDPPPPPPPNGSNSVILLLRLSALMLALSSAIVVAASSECIPSSGVVTFTYTYTRFGAFVLLVGCSITAAILEAVAIHLQLRLDLAAAAAPDPDDKTVATDMEEEEEGIGPAGIALVLVDLLVPALLYSALAAAYTAAAAYGDQIGACARFAGQVRQAKILSLSACAAITLSGVAKGVPLPFNVPPVL